MKQICINKGYWIAVLAIGTGMQLFATFKPAEVKIPEEITFDMPAQEPNYQKTETLLFSSLKRDLAGKDPEEILKDQKLMTSVLAWDAIETAGSEKLTKLALKKAKYAHFLQTFLKDREWMILYAGAGLVPTNTEKGMEVLADIWALDGRSADFRDFLNLSTGIATTWGAYRNNELRSRTIPSHNPIWRYFFFKQSWFRGDLQRDFMSLRPWEIRFVVTSVWGDRSYAWLQERINVHPDQWHNACWITPYCGFSEFGDTIQAPLYYVAFDPEKSIGEKSVNHGAVCGGISKTAAAAASAHGFPAYTSGQPGHCAYAYRRSRGQWIGGFGGPGGGPATWIFPGLAMPSIDLMEAAFADDSVVDRCAQLAAIAHVAEAVGMKPLTEKAWTLILKTNPFNYNMQMDFQKRALKNGSMKGKWADYSRYIMKTYQKYAGMIMAVIEPIEKEATATLNTAEKIAWLTDLDNAINTRNAGAGNSAWERAWRGLPDDSKVRVEFLAGLLNTELKQKQIVPFVRALLWTSKQTAGNRFEKDLFAALNKVPHLQRFKSLKGEERRQMLNGYGQVIVQAEERASLDLFNRFSDFLHDAGEDNGFDKGRKLTLPPGKLLSDQALLKISSSHPKDTPWAHRKIMTGEDGGFITRDEKEPCVFLKFPHAVKITSLLIVRASDHPEQCEKLKISYSADNNKWVPLRENQKVPEVWRIDLPEAITAGWIKVERLADKPIPFRLRNILVFGE